MLGWSKDLIIVSYSKSFLWSFSFNYFFLMTFAALITCVCIDLTLLTTPKPPLPNFLMTS